jgi:hypothetical protein
MDFWAPGPGGPVPLPDADAVRQALPAG